MKLKISFLKLINEFSELPFGMYIVKVKFNERAECLWFVSYDADGLTVSPCEIPMGCEFEYEIYSETFMTEAIRFYNHELKKNL